MGVRTVDGYLWYIQTPEALIAQLNVLHGAWGRALNRLPLIFAGFNDFAMVTAWLWASIAR